MALSWKQITAEHVLEAIQRYAVHPERYTQAKHTFLVYEGHDYPAKAVRGLAYEVCYGEKISQDAFTGGKETARFFERLGFTVRTGGDAADTHVTIMSPSKSIRQVKRRHFDKVTQKNALQALLQRRFGIVITEKVFDWLRVPSLAQFDPLYHQLYAALQQYRGYENFIQPGRRLPVDFFVESLNLIIEYDEDQHFSRARQLTLESYPSDLCPGYSIDEWMGACVSVKAADNDPPSRDETRAFYDAVRDIEIPRRGVRLMRLRHGNADWEAPDAEEVLLKILQPYLPVAASTPIATESTNRALDYGIDWRAMEVEFQRIRLNYLKWCCLFTPPQDEVIRGCGAGEQYWLLESAYGRSFTVSPAGLGAVYVGAGKGCIGLPPACFTHTPELDAETQYLKSSLRRRTQAVKDTATHLLDVGNLSGAWDILLEYWWLKLGMHEYAHDVAYQVGYEGKAIQVNDLILTDGDVSEYDPSTTGPGTFYSAATPAFSPAWDDLEPFCLLCL